MPSFSSTSEEKLDTCHPDLVRLFREVIKTRDCTILDGHRGAEEQNEAFRKGYSRLAFPHSKHNSVPSMAIDVAPYFECEPHIRWNDSESFYNFIGYVQRVADELGVKIRSGADWDMDYDFHDQTFFDLPHFELVADE